MSRYKIDFPSLFFIICTGLIILASVVALRWNQSKYLLESVSPGILSHNFSEQQAEVFQDESVLAMQQASVQAQPGKRNLDAVTFVLWFVFGIVAYYLCYGFYAGFIHPISEDAAEAHYVHANPQRALLLKRILWFLAIIFTCMLAYGVYSLYQHVVLTYYMASIYDPGIINGAMFLGSIVVTSLMVSAVRLGARVVIRAY